MIMGSRRKRPTPAESDSERQRVARMRAPLLRELQASATCVSVKLTFAVDTRLEQETRSFEIHPPARAYFVYPCAFGDCNGRHDLDVVVRGLLRTGATQASGALQCGGHRSGGVVQGARCGLGLTYTISVQLDPSQTGTNCQPAATT
ncbi:MAG: hypothetical protein MUF07_05020 [Steroidobacteraceae bacterium]|jgi:hypothetical protein|nr:hypothetical protein [Steroidobacteraceae bacterium]